MNIELIKEIINSWKDDIEFTFIELLPNVIMDRSKGIIYYTILPPIGDDSGVIIIFDQCFPKKILKFYSHSSLSVLGDDLLKLKDHLERFFNVEYSSNEYTSGDLLRFNYSFIISN
jgi:hypothetical protein